MIVGGVSLKAAPAARQDDAEKASIIVNGRKGLYAQRRRIELIGALEALRGLLLLAGDVEDQCGMQVLEESIPICAAKLVDGVGSLLREHRRDHRADIRHEP